MTLVSELLKDLPDQVLSGDFVLRLSEGVADPEQALSSYVVTPQLAGSFDQALGVIRQALSNGTSKAAYLHGSFGSGKSHFMAVLHALLRHDPHARAIPELAAIVAKHDQWLAGRRFLLVPYHLIGASSLESAILGGYVKHVLQVHPDAALPPVYVADKIFEDARTLRTKMGEDKFLEGLGGGPAGAGSWGSYGGGWTTAQVDAALSAPPNDAERNRLFSDLVLSYYSAYRDVAASGGAASYVSLDEGLVAIAAHAKELGYDALLLFLDELILWLASNMADHSFVAHESSKVVKLVEAAGQPRAVPVVSFMARQRDLRELIGTHVPGAEQLAFADGLSHSQGRFDTVHLDDRNLPVIAQRRILAPKDDAAKRQIDQAFETVARMRRETMDVLLGSDADRDAFRATYPFSPAFVSTLVAVSSALQRERTALKVMLQLLVDQRSTLELGQVVPVGDLWDVVAAGDEPFTDELRGHFENAKRLYVEKLRPMLLREHGLTEEEAEQQPRKASFRTDDRLIKTLLLSGLVPEVEALRNLTAGKLAALNHGLLATPIQGQEKRIVLSKLRTWAGEVGEIRIGDDTADPIISLELSSVDVDRVLQRARGVDNVGERRRLVRRLVSEALGIGPQETFTTTHDFTWRGSRRSVEVAFGNVRDPRDLPDAALVPEGAGWRVVIDFPFDDEGYGPHDDLARLDALRLRQLTGRTVVWLPSFLSARRQEDVGTLVVLEHLLAGERFESYASHLPPQDRQPAKSILANRAASLTERLKSVLLAAYGASRAETADLQVFEGAETLRSLDPSFTPQLPVGGTLSQAFESLADQMLKAQFPAHPDLDSGGTGTAVRQRDLAVVFEEVCRAVEQPDGRVIVDSAKRRTMARIANPLRLGEMHEAPFVLGRYWEQHFLRKAAEEEVTEEIPVPRLREWIDEPQPMGLAREVQNLLIASFAAQTDRSLYRASGAAVPLGLDVSDDLLLRQPALPAEDEWQKARERSRGLFGTVVAALRSAANVAHVARVSREEAARRRPDAARLVAALRTHIHELGREGLEAGRLRTAEAALNLVDAVRDGDDLTVIAALAGTDLPVTEVVVSKSLTAAADVATAVESTNWTLLRGLEGLTDDRRQSAEQVLQRLREVAAHDEHAAALAPALKEAVRRASELLVAPTPPPAPRATSATAVVHRVTGRDREAVARQLAEYMDAHAEELLEITWRVVEGDA
ncbi:DUF6079 family protein [Geodermatophilus sp. SYSU D00965]